MTKVRSGSTTAVENASLRAQVGGPKGGVNRLGTRTVLATTILGVMAHVDLLGVGEEARGKL
jgi:hypothetical protein